MGSYPVSSNSYQNYGYPYPQNGTQNENLPEPNGSLLTSDNPHAGSLPVSGVQDNRVISNKTIKKHLDEANQALKPKKKGLFQKIGDFFKGIGHAIKNIFTTLANPKNWLLIGGAIALCILCPPAGAVLAGVGALMAGNQMIKGVATGNWEQVGEGTLNLGLSVAGFKGATSSVKAGGGKFTVSGTKSADAQANLLKAETELGALQKSGADASTIQKAEQAVTEATHAQKAALGNQTRIETARMNWFSKRSFLKSTGTKNLSVEQVQLKVAQSNLELSAARAQVSEAQLALKEAVAGGSSKTIAEAESNYAAAQANLGKANQTHLDLLKAERIKQLQGMGMGERSKTYAQDNWATTRDSIETVRGKTLTSADGRTLNYWKRTPKGPAGETSPAAAGSESMLTQVKNWWSPTSKTEDVATAQHRSNGVSMPTPSGGPITPPSDVPNGQDSQKAAAAARAAKQAVMDKWQQWRQSQQTKDLAAAAWNNQLNALVPVAQLNNQNQGKPFNSGSQPQALNVPNQFNLEVPA
jgi:hypothetical protein